jgi:DNA-binding response OmpR family regulator
LVVDDDADIRELVAFRLRQVGFEVLVEPDGERGLATALEVKPDVLVLDWAMPGLTGPDLCRRLREEPAIAGARVLLVTAGSIADRIDQALAAGVDDVLPKPFSGRELILRVRALVDGAGGHVERPVRT